MTPLEQAMALIDQLCEPAKMSKHEALDFLEEIAAELEGRMDALREEIAGEEG